MTSFNNRSDQKERAAILKNDAATLHQFAQSEASEIGGRFAKPQTVNASEQAVHYPRLPTSSPWSNPIEAVEPPLGFSVDETPIVGEAFEVEASLNQDFGWRRTIQDGAPSPSSGTSSRPGDDGLAAPDATAVSPSSSGTPRPDDDLGKGPHVASEGGGNTNHDRGRRAPSPSKSNIKRRLI
jgi:hypothetical protein